MKPSTLIDAVALNERIRAGHLLVVDCRFDLADPARGARDHAQGHIPGAVYANLDTDLSDLSKSNLGRHPLPDASAFSKTLSRWGWNATLPVVAYDAANGALAAARLWWMLRLVGQDDVSVLDGGIAAWTRAGFKLDAHAPNASAGNVDVAFDGEKIVYTDQLRELQKNPQTMLLDARATPRYRGEVEPIDRVAGHVPGARNRPFSENLAADGRFKSVDNLRAEFDALLQTHAPSDVVHMCGSGVTACHNLLAMEYAGLSGSRVYAPSWSGWISDPTHAVARDTQ